MVETMKERHITPKSVVFLADDSKGSASVGTLTSILMLFEKNPIGELLRMLSPFYLNPRDERTAKVLSPKLPWLSFFRKLDSYHLGYDRHVKCWTAPYIMQAIDTRIVNRSNAISGWSYGESFVYYERMKAKNFFVAALVTFALAIVDVLLLLPPARMILKMLLPRLDRGPNQDLLDNGYFGMKLVGLGTDQQTGKDTKIFGSIFAEHGDPGYRYVGRSIPYLHYEVVVVHPILTFMNRQTAKMVTEAAICLATNPKNSPQVFGVLTPSVAFGKVLRDRLYERGIEFAVEEAK